MDGIYVDPNAPLLATLLDIVTIAEARGHRKAARRLVAPIDYAPNTECIAATLSSPDGARHLIIMRNRL